MAIVYNDFYTFLVRGLPFVRRHVRTQVSLSGVNGEVDFQAVVGPASKLQMPIVGEKNTLNSELIWNEMKYDVQTANTSQSSTIPYVIRFNTHNDRLKISNTVYLQPTPLVVEGKVSHV